MKPAAHHWPACSWQEEESALQAEPEAQLPSLEQLPGRLLLKQAALQLSPLWLGMPECKNFLLGILREDFYCINSRMSSQQCHLECTPHNNLSFTYQAMRKMRRE